MLHRSKKKGPLARLLIVPKMKKIAVTVIKENTIQSEKLIDSFIIEKISDSSLKNSIES